MRSASAVSHQMPNSAMPAPAITKITSSTPTGTPSAKQPSAAGHGSASSMPVRIGKRGRQRKPISAPAIVPAPIAAARMPYTARVS